MLHLPEGADRTVLTDPAGEVIARACDVRREFAFPLRAGGRYRLSFEG
ncbi:hypothetical protein ACWCYY_31180 [Kitasatospora sp. NPDC001664]